MKKYSAKNTALNNKWALKNFEDWFKAKRNTTEKTKTAIERDVFYVCPSTVYKPRPTMVHKRSCREKQALVNGQENVLLSC